jgi:uncharacterized protein (TIGR02145 family)
LKRRGEHISDLRCKLKDNEIEVTNRVTSYESEIAQKQVFRGKPVVITILFVIVLASISILIFNKHKFSKCIEDAVTDADGNTYDAIRIGDQIWTIENLKTTKYNDGTSIPMFSNKFEWQESRTPAYCWYNNDINNKMKYGALYNWYAVKTGKLAPKGWHVSTNEEWTKLEKYMIDKGFNWDKTRMNNKIAKSLAAKTDWSTNKGGTGDIGNNLAINNKSGFSALPGGYRSFDGNFNNINTMGCWWGGTLFCEYGFLGKGFLGKGIFHDNCGCSIRLLRD